jgi:hypothetical protein
MLMYFTRSPRATRSLFKVKVCLICYCLSQQGKGKIVPVLFFSFN